MATPFSVSDFLSGKSNDQVISELLSWQEGIAARLSQLHPGRAEFFKNSRELPLNMLPFKERVEAMRRYRSIVGLDEVLSNLALRDVGGNTSQFLLDNISDVGRARGLHNIAGNLRAMKGGLGTESPYFKMPVSYSPGGSVLDAIYASMNINFDLNPKDIRAGLTDAAHSAIAASHFGIGTESILKFSPHMLNMSPSLAPGKRFLSFDIETAGLMKGQIREVGYRTGIVGSAGDISGGASGQLLFNPIMFRRGTMGVEMGGRVHARTLNDFLGARPGNFSDDFASAMMPFLKSMRDTDYIIGHNITAFDLPQVYHQLTNSAAYNKGTIAGFRDLVDQAFSGIDSKIVDTLTLAQRARNLTGISVDAQLGRISSTPYSIANLLLQTDLSERIGTDQLRTLLASKGLHNADVDDLVTRGLLQHLDQLQLKPVMDSAMRTAILSSAAITPTTNAAVHSQISDQALRHLIANVEGGIVVPTGPGYSAANSKLASLLQNAGKDAVSASKAFNMIRSNADLSGLSFKINPIQQQVFETRNLGLGLSPNFDKNFDPSSYIFRTNMYDRFAYSGAKRSQRGTNLISSQTSGLDPDAYAAFQRSMAKINMPFAGLSQEERRFGTALNLLTRGVDDTSEIIGDLTGDTMVATFRGFDPNEVQYFVKSGRSSLPAKLLSNYLKDGTLLSLSTVTPSASSEKSAINLVHRFSSAADADSFASFLESLHNQEDKVIAKALGMDPEATFAGSAVQKFRSAMGAGLSGHIRKHGETVGVSVGQLYGEQDGVDDVFSALREVHGLENLRDDQMLPFRLPYMESVSPDLSGGGGFIRTAGAVLDSGLTDNDVTNIAENVSRTRKIYSGFVDLASNPNRGNEFGAAKLAAHMGEDASARIMAVYEGFQKIKPRLGLGLGIAALAGIGIYAAKKHEENEQYSEVFDRQPIEIRRKTNVANLLEAKQAAGIDMSRQGYNPLATAYVVDNLNAVKIGHTNMSNSKNTNLYGGVL